MTDNVAVLQGFTEEVTAYSGDMVLDLLIQPDANLDTTVRVWDMDEQCFVTINGWLWTFEWHSQLEQTA